MKFYGNGIVWDSNKNKLLCRFTKGTYETNDKYEIDYLLSKGYDNDGVQEEVKEKEIKEDKKQNTPKRKR